MFLRQLTGWGEMMGQCLGSELTDDEKNARTQSADIDKDLYELAKKEMNVVKILMLGAAESGKSTLVKQMKIIHSHGFTKQELTSFKPAVLDNLLTSMKFVLYGMGVLRINLANSKNKIHAHSVLSCGRCFDEDQTLFPFLARALRCLWADHGVRAAAARGYEYELNDSALFFFENMDRIVSPDYLPTEMDVLRVRLRTTGVIETQFKVNHLIIRMYDVGGQRTERRKWISCFEDVRAVLFVVALSGYDMTLKEDPSMNRLQESLKLFSSICSNVFFRSTSMMLFLNKIDLFQEKILHSGRHLRLYFPEFTGADCDVDAAARFIAGMFGVVSTMPDKLIYHHFTTATDTSNVQVVFQVVMDTIMKENLEAVSLL
ncbi:guanine nucleotide binding protein (G protein) alpha v1 [Brienomyrus brachyistius]|uniref:guanine nucleotide binding protein (G protein) alpha v1 n=1 Tax=Brienomyrus brachyistius TaxID=42636 RepID=UPI0020B306C3|nr:guanine nucleotide binding protein (G protein) alpha v1 [Brienomyrus brachyistius]